MNAVGNRQFESDGAQGGTRTHTSRGHRNLNPACLPIPTPGRSRAIVPELNLRLIHGSYSFVFCFGFVVASGVVMLTNTSGRSMALV